MKPSAQSRSFASAASKQRAASAADQSNGFSHSTCLPAASAATTHSVCRCVGQRHIDGVDVVARQHRRVTVEGLFDAGSGRESRGSRRITAGHGPG